MYEWCSITRTIQGSITVVLYESDMTFSFSAWPIRTTWNCDCITRLGTTAINPLVLRVGGMLSGLTDSGAFYRQTRQWSRASSSTATALWFFSMNESTCVEAQLEISTSTLGSCSILCCWSYRLYQPVAKEWGMILLISQPKTMK